MGRIDQRTREVGLATVVLIMLAYSWLFSDVSVPNERTRVYLTVALLDHGTLAIDEPLRRFGRVYDLAQSGGQFFTDKAPGSSLLALPLYALVRSWSAASDWTIVDLCNLFRTYLMLPFGLAGFLLLRSLLRAWSVSEPAIDLSSFAFSLGSPMLHYSGAFYGHAIVAVLVLAGLRCLAAAELLGAIRTGGLGLSTMRWLAALGGAGACAGLAGLVEYQAIVLGAVLVIPVLFVPGRRLASGLLAYCAGALPFAAALLVYNARAFGGPFELSYQHLVGATLQELHGFGLAGATVPTRETLAGILTSEHRGLFATSPYLALGLVALPLLVRRIAAPLWLAIALGTGYFVLIVASSSVWFGGWSFGPRLLTPILGLLAIAAAFGFDACARLPVLQWLARVAAIVSVLYQHAVSAAFAELPPEFLRPLPDAIWPMLRAGLVAPNLVCKVWGLERLNLLPLACVLALLVVWLAQRGAREFRALQAGVCVVVAALALGALSVAKPSISPREQAGWLRTVERWRTTETRCRDRVPPP